MKVSLNIVRRLAEKYDSAKGITDIGVEKLVAKIGAQLGGVDEVLNLGKRYDSVTVVKVVSCQKHPNADKLSVCLIDDNQFIAGVERNDQNLVQVVCGAPNVHEGMLAAWIPPGNVVPSTFDKDPFTLEVREIRGVASNGMLASPKELGIGDSHEGILEIEADVKPGVPFDEVVGFDNEVILDIENKMFTHRPDCFGFLGISRELAGIQQLAFKSPPWYTPNPEFPAIEAEELSLTIKNELPELVSRFTAIIMSGVEVGPSPLWLQVALAELGQKSINNIVDYTNFYMLETGQPLHAYDYDKIKALSQNEATIVIRNPKPGEKIKLLNGKEITPRAEAIMIATDQQLIGLGGVMGGSETEVDEGTKNIILECANFDMYSVRRTSMTHGLFTEAVTRFTKGQSPLQNLAVLAKIVDEIRGHAAGKVAGSVIDDNHLDQAVLERASLHPPVKLTADFVNTRLGLKLTASEMQTILENVEFKVEITGDELTVTAPFWRTDIELREDVVEEIGRLYGYDHLPLELPKRDLTPPQKDPLLTLKAQIRAQLAKAGANELLTYSFVHGDLLQKVGQDPAKAFQLSNALSPDLQYYRLSLIPSLLDKVHSNLKAGYDEFALFELGKAHDKVAVDEQGMPLEFDNLALVYAFNKSNKATAAYYEARHFLVELAASLGYELEFDPLVSSNIHQSTPFEIGRSAVIKLKGSTEGFGVVGEFTASTRRNLKLPARSAGFELGIGALINTQPKQTYVPLPRFPAVMQDITLRVPTELAYQELFDFVSAEVEKTKPVNSLVELSPLGIYQKEDSSKNITLRLKIASYERTLTDATVNKLLDEVAAAAQQKINATRI